jgi:hypothetical protein
VAICKDISTFLGPSSVFFLAVIYCCGKCIMSHKINNYDATKKANIGTVSVLRPGCDLYFRF